MLLLYDGRLVTGTHVRLVGARPTARVGVQVLDLSELSSLSLHVAQDYSLNLVFGLSSRSLGDLSFDEGVFRHEEGVASLLRSDSLAQLRVAALSLGYLLLNPGPAPRLPFYPIFDSWCIDPHLMHFVVVVGKGRRLCPLRRGLLETTGVASCSFRVDGILRGH